MPSTSIGIRPNQHRFISHPFKGQLISRWLRSQVTISPPPAPLNSSVPEGLLERENHFHMRDSSHLPWGLTRWRFPVFYSRKGSEDPPVLPSRFYCPISPIQRFQPSLGRFLTSFESPELEVCSVVEGMVRGRLTFGD